jgi:hypothetical protein
MYHSFLINDVNDKLDEVQALNNVFFYEFEHVKKYTKHIKMLSKKNDVFFSSQ